jgi:hypothetical protein
MTIILERPIEDVGNKEISHWMTIWQQVLLGALPRLVLLAGVGDLVTEPHEDIFKLFH